MVQMRAIYQAGLIIAECSPLKTKSLRRSREGVGTKTHFKKIIKQNKKLCQNL